MSDNLEIVMVAEASDEHPRRPERTLRGRATSIPRAAKI